MPKLICYISIVFLIANVSLAQSIATDSRGKDVFDFYKTKSFSLPISAATSSAKINYTFQLGPAIQFYGIDPNVQNFLIDTIQFSEGHYRSQDSSRFTLAKSYGLNVSFMVGNLVSNLAKVSTFHPTYTLSAGLGYNIDVFNNWANIRTLKYGFYNWNFNPYISSNNLIIYDSTKHSQFRKKPWSEGVAGEFTYFLPPRITKTGLIGISASFTYEFGNNISTLKNFQKNKPTYTDFNVISLGDFVGKLGDLQNENNIRARISIPIFIPAVYLFKNPVNHKPKDSLQMALIPYYSLYGMVNTHLTSLVGIYINASQGQNLFSNNSTIISGFGLGIDWSAASNGLSNISIFVAGSLELHNLFAHKKHDWSFIDNKKT